MCANLWALCGCNMDYLALRELGHDARKASLHHSFLVYLASGLSWLLTSSSPGTYPTWPLLTFPPNKLPRPVHAKAQCGWGWGWQKTSARARAFHTNYTNTALETETERLRHFVLVFCSFVSFGPVQAYCRASDHNFMSLIQQLEKLLYVHYTKT